MDQNRTPAIKWFFEDHDEHKFYRYIIFQGVRDPEDCPPHDHNRNHWTRCLQGEVEVTLQMPGGEPKSQVLKPGDPAILVPAIAMHSAVGLVPNSKMVCEFDHVNGEGHPISRLGPRWVYC